MVFTVSLKDSNDNSVVSGRDVSVDYQTFDDTGDTATSGLDYVATSGNLTILAGQRTGRVTVPVLNDTLDEPAETFTMELLTNPDNAEFAGQANSVSNTGTITDDNDPATDLQITPSKAKAPSSCPPTTGNRDATTRQDDRSSNTATPPPCTATKASPPTWRCASAAHTWTAPACTSP